MCHWLKCTNSLARVNKTHQLHRETTTWSFDSHKISLCSLKLWQICVPASIKQTIFFPVFSFFELGDFLIKHLMTIPAGNSQFCFLLTSMLASALPRGTLRISGKQDSLFPLGHVVKCSLSHKSLGSCPKHKTITQNSNPKQCFLTSYWNNFYWQYLKYLQYHDEVESQRCSPDPVTHCIYNLGVF